ncbi:hypothetical protein Sme01_51680 [Sphaerisporangium melleum]|uniref:Uncharacterized protein n=2 Tax=Sphaerisporangium melleum TaxID=321316 RepID=A0A917QY60_9ACTN|nr:hypothetical protein GCM10007964_18440 [Sphaerisporangium melleum]GII72692.1 hypothetical protein Sme01_51680 [Sphaerisporangium melleum]
MCAEPLDERHGHAVDTGTRALLCVCGACRMLLSAGGTVVQGRYQAVPERYLYVPSLRMSEADWTELQIPVRTAFLFHNSALGRFVAFYPSPGGATESLLDLSAWDRVLAANPGLPTARPDVEAYLVDRREDGFACYLVPIDACYELVGLVRVHWKGFQGGPEAARAIDAFFDRLRRRGEVIAETGRPAGPDLAASAAARTRGASGGDRGRGGDAGGRQGSGPGSGRACAGDGAGREARP